MPSALHQISISEVLLTAFRAFSRQVYTTYMHHFANIKIQLPPPPPPQPNWENPPPSRPPGRRRLRLSI
jgi:hypothetical protein